VKKLLPQQVILAEYLKVPYISLFTNGTLPLLTALQTLGIKGEVITTPYTICCKDKNDLRIKKEKGRIV